MTGLNYTLFFICHFNIVKQNMKTYFLVWRKNADNINSEMIKTKNGRLQLKSIRVQFVEIKKVNL